MSIYGSLSDTPTSTASSPQLLRLLHPISPNSHNPFQRQLSLREAPVKSTPTECSGGCREGGSPLMHCSHGGHATTSQAGRSAVGFRGGKPPVFTGVDIARSSAQLQSVPALWAGVRGRQPPCL